MLSSWILIRTQVGEGPVVQVSPVAMKSADGKLIRVWSLDVAIVSHQMTLQLTSFILP